LLVILRRLAAALALTAGGTWCAAQPGADPSTVVAQVESAYQRLEYAEAEALARQALANFSVFTPDQIVRLRTTLGLIYFARNETTEAAEQFRFALSVNPNLALDPLLVSPTTIAFFETTKEAFLRERQTGHAGEAVTRFIVVNDARPGATWRSLVLPGWGQRHRGARTKGWLLTGAAVATLGGGLGAHVERQRARRAYLEEQDPALIEDRYQTYRTWHNVRGGLFLGAAAVWAYAAVDALVVRGAVPEGAPVEVTPGGAGLQLRWRF